jgi:hypothetical protein
LIASYIVLSLGLAAALVATRAAVFCFGLNVIMRRDILGFAVVAQIPIGGFIDVGKIGHRRVCLETLFAKVKNFAGVLIAVEVYLYRLECLKFLFGYLDLINFVVG